MNLPKELKIWPEIKKSFEYDKFTGKKVYFSYRIPLFDVHCPRCWVELWDMDDISSEDSFRGVQFCYKCGRNLTVPPTLFEKTKHFFRHAFDMSYMRRHPLVWINKKK